MKRPRRAHPSRPIPIGLPTRSDLDAFLKANPDADVETAARAFGLKGAERRALREMMREQKGRVSRSAARRREDGLPPVAVADVVEQDADGELYVRRANRPDDPPVRLGPSANAAPGGAPGPGDRLLVRFERQDDGETLAVLIRTLGAGRARVLGVVRKARGAARLEPVDRRSKDVYALSPLDASRLADGDLALADVQGRASRFGPARAEIREVLGKEDDPACASILAIHTHGLKTGFSQDALDEAEACGEPSPAGRQDLRALPFVTIDPADARDHDDAVCAVADPDRANPGGFELWVAIADVAAFVREGSALDREAYAKGNSAYFPDRVEPMLPERLSNGLCSLSDGVDRACLAVVMRIDKEGRHISHRFVRAVIRSRASLSYEVAQDVFDGKPAPECAELAEPLGTLWAAYAALRRARERRAPLEIASAERRIRLGADGTVLSVEPRLSLEAHKLIEECMVQANACAAETLEQRRIPLIYRVHESPSDEKLLALADFLDTIGFNWTRAPARTERFNTLLRETRDGPHGEIVNEVVLRTQAQAVYSPDNAGHFGLNLDRYAHFTSPIRRYADLVVHRGLLKALGEPGGLSSEAAVRLEEIARHITDTERRAMAAERDAGDRYLAAFLSERVGAEFSGRVTGVTRFGLFVRLDETGADGLVPISTLGPERYVHDDRAHALVAERSGVRYVLGARVQVRLREAAPLTGGLLLELLTDPSPRLPGHRPLRLGVRRRQDARPPRRR